MLFNSIPFLFFFLPAVLLGIYLIGRMGRTPALLFLNLASLFFYAWWNPKYLLLLLGSITFNLLCAHAIAHAKRPSIPMWIGVCGNVGLLCFYKYLFPILNSFGSLMTPEHNFGSIILPLGISFFTLTQIGYLVDLAQQDATLLSPVEHVFFVSFFPHLIAGPILHHREFMPQVFAKRDFRLDWNQLAIGGTWFIMGLFKKVVLADTIAPRADLLFNAPANQPMFSAWCGILSYALQLYFDFSGYSDMAIGLARMFGLRFPMNFNSPYKAQSIIEFWQRWHITLTHFITLYIYNPVAMAINRSRLDAGLSIGKKALKSFEGFTRMVCVPLLVTMIVAGVWHGAGRQFLAFGLLHGIYLCINHAWRTWAKALGKAIEATRIGRVFYVVLTLAAVILAQIFFRADSVPDAYAVIRSALGLHGLGAMPHADHIFWLMIAAFFAICWSLPNTQEILGEGDRPVRLQWRPTLAWGLAISATFFLCFVLMKPASRFLYFQF
ncbi:MBOAT family O-acyltransferase [Candidatus Korobacter versatilis]|nr:MBOAT family O-acyltransferase [Candidatus Koribacter versatilis]